MSDFYDDDEDDMEPLLDDAPNGLFQKTLSWALTFFGQRRRDYRSTFRTPHGRRVLRDLAGECGFMKPPPQGSDALTYARYAEAMRIFEHICTQLKLRESEAVELAHSYAKDET